MITAATKKSITGRPLAQRLISQGERLYSLSLWDYLPTDHIIGIENEVGEPCFVNCVNGAVNFYPGIDSLRSLLKIISTHKSEPWFVTSGFQHCLSVLFLRSDELTEDESRFLRAFGRRGITPSNEGNLAFRAHVPGFMPRPISQREASFLERSIHVLVRNLNEIRYRICHLLPDEIFMITAEGIKIRALTEILPPDGYGPVCDDFTVMRLRAKRKTPLEMVYDLYFVPKIITREGELRRVITAADITGKPILCAKLPEKARLSTEKALIETFASICLEKGRPMAVHTRDWRVSHALGDLCRKIEVDLMMSV